jgi:DNA-binding protein H-NS
VQLPDSTDEPLTARERAAVIHRIRTLVEYWGITPEELEQATPYVAAAAECLPSGTVKYRHPRSGDTWDGHGAHPQWLRDALLKEGFTVDELRPATDDFDRTTGAL